MNSNFSVLVAFVVFLLHSTNSMKLDVDGGYSIVIALEPSTKELADVDSLVVGITATLQTFSEQLFAASYGKFYLKHADLLLPSSWHFSSAASTTQSYQTADIRLNPLATSPFVENPNTCGLPGRYIELPFWFMNTTLPQPYGPPSKALLNLWGRYRYGVWEEHGSPSSTMFPYFSRETRFDAWEATSCSNTELEGTFTDLQNNPCGSLDGAKPDVECRFRPSPNNLAKSSIMGGFHWLNSVKHFCSEDTHDKLSPTPQNLYCNHDSVWTIIESSADFAKATDKITTVPPIGFGMVKKSEFAPLYILLDTGSFTDNFEANDMIANFIKSLTTTIEELPMTTTVSLGTFYSNSDSSSIVTQVGWTTLYDGLDKIQNAIKGTALNGDFNPTFGQPLMEAINAIAALNSPIQSALLVLKTGRYSSYYGSMIPEEELAFALKKNGIKLFAAELENDWAEFPRHLRRLATVSSDGFHASLKDIVSAEQNVELLLGNMKEFLNKEAPLVDTSNSLLFHGKIFANQRLTIPFTTGMEKGLAYFLTLDELVTPKINRTAGTGTISSRTAFAESQISVPKKVVHSSYWNVPDSTKEFFLEYNCGEELDCPSGDVLITSYYADPSVVATISISSANNEIDFSKPSPHELAPFIIYTKVEKNGNPVKDLLVEARVELITPGAIPVVVRLEDNGFGSPDLFKNDGIYSGVHLPYNSGAHKISVLIRYQKDGAISSRKGSDGNIGAVRLLPEDQVIIAEKEAVNLDTSFVNVVDYPAPIVFRNNIGRYELSKPYKILDLSASFDSGETDITLRFTSPRLLDSEGQATHYTVQGAKSIETLIYSTPDVRNILVVTDISDADAQEKITFPAVPDLNYYRVLANYTGFISSLSQASNIVAVFPSESIETSPQPETTVANPPESSPDVEESTEVNPPASSPAGQDTTTEASGVKEICSTLLILAGVLSALGY